ncbi:Beta-barrel assembly machine subunit BamD [Cricetibacter osteomyelitidis]|uniref:Outer membrane protein assembly factor BamD n=1 Tax=Cricetibacter osteomyelitidis TaxID=1521931 RepID=A0A4R2T1J5_9PAST|nr:outer membrane protein assembly factor BamD [Cricetibacter osteomyelitidis]TCP95221.1 Beta-barrel assembly machine subunit BamD [Cricetibacter osteomyelitidis]
MRNLKRLALITFTVLAVTACSGSSKEDQVAQGSLLELNERAQYYLNDENYGEAVRYLEAIESRYPGSANSEQNQLDLIYSYYQRQDYTNTLSIAERFLRAHPTSRNLDYVLYMAGLTNQALGDNFLQDLFNIDRASRETTTIKNAYGNFETLIQHFPNSKYALDASLRMTYLKKRVAKHELEIAEFYEKRKAYVAVVNRCLGLLSRYPDTWAAQEARPLLKEAYEALGLTEMAAKTEQLIEQNKDKTYADVEKPEDPDVTPPRVNATN